MRKCVLSVGQMPVGRVDEKDRLKVGTGGESYQCDQLAQWKIG